MYEVLEIVRLVLIVIVSLLSFLLILKFSADMITNLRKISNIKRLKKCMDTMAAAATVFKTDVIEKNSDGKKEKLRLVFFEYTAGEKTYCKKMLLTYSAFNEVSKCDKVNIYYEKHNPEDCVLKEDWEERTYKYYLQWDIAYIFCILVFVAINVVMKLV